MSFILLNINLKGVRVVMRNPVEIGFKSVTDNRAPQYLDVDAPFPVRED